MRNYKKWIMFTKMPVHENIYVAIGTKELKEHMDYLELREDITIEGIFPCVEKGVTLRIYWREK